MSATGFPLSPPGGSAASNVGFVARCEGDAVLTCSGELDRATASRLRTALEAVLRLGPDRLILDLSDLSFFDASAIGEFVRADTACREAGGALVIRSPSPFARHVLRIVGLTDLIEPEPVEDSGQVSELAAAWEVACSTARYGSAAMEFDPMVMLPAIAAMLNNPESVSLGAGSAGSSPAPTLSDGPVSATAVLQLWALNDVLHARIETTGGGKLGHERQEQQRADVEAALTSMASAVLARLEQSTLLDPLTGLLNRRALDRDLLQALATARRHSQYLSVVMIDVVDLKSTNDKLGHAAGDDLLRSVASNLASMMRAGDNVYRIGGDEFVLVLPNLGPDDVTVVMDRAVAGTRGAFTWGCAWVKGDEDSNSDSETAAHLLAMADRRMLEYRSRIRRGRSHEQVDEGAQVTPSMPAETQVELAGEFTSASQASALVDAATGLIAEHLQIDIDEASRVLSRFAAAQSQSVEATAAALVDRTISIAQLAAADASEHSSWSES